jgi:hypothetical protein
MRLQTVTAEVSSFSRGVGRFSVPSAAYTF